MVKIYRENIVVMDLYGSYYMAVKYINQKLLDIQWKLVKNIPFNKYIVLITYQAQFEAYKQM